MKTFRSAAASYRRTNSGVALVMVLVVLVLVAGLAATLLNMARSERSSSSVFLTSNKIRQHADNVVGIVQAQINQASTGGSTVAWASQPGMVRTYKTDGALKMAYKLYSATSLTETDATKLSSDLPPAAWASSKSIWVDLNAPVTANGQSIFPIVDPSILDLPVTQKPLGFAINSAPGSTVTQRAPMPVKWLYILQDGTIVAPSGSGDVATISGATASNPITGRIAFWTDDESCKVNLNTSGVGSYWDTPHFYTTEDRKFATSQPLNGEFQRYPGHPAMTSLTAVFPQLTDEQILSTLTPRYQWGGSKQGTVDTYKMTAALNNGTVANNPLYAAVDDMIFQLSYTSRAANGNLSKDIVRKAEFFLTADSRAPEVNLFNLPRISCWPISVNDKGRTTFDKVIAFASTLGNYVYYFQRGSAVSPTSDAGLQRNKDIFGYLQYLTDQKIPGFGVDLASKFGADRNQILTEIWDYIRSTNLYDTRLAAGNQFTADTNVSGSGYGYVAPLENVVGSTTYRGFGRSITLAELGFVFICTADATDRPKAPATPNPLGLLASNDPVTNLTLGGTALKSNERRIQMMIVPTFFSPSQGNIAMRPKAMSITIAGLDTLKLGGTQLFSNPSASLKFDDVTFNTYTHRRFIGGPFDYRALLRGRVTSGTSSLFGPMLDSGATPQYPYISKFVTVTASNPIANDPGTMKFDTGQLIVTIEVSINGAPSITTQTIKVAPPATSDIPIPNLVRTGTTAIGTPPAVTLPATTPQYWWAFSDAPPVTGLATNGRLGNLENDPGFYKIANDIAVEASLNSAKAGTLIREAETADPTYYTDVVRSMAPSHGDFRLIMGLKTVPSSAFTPVGTWTDTGAKNALLHTMITGNQNAQSIPGGSQLRRHYMTTDPMGPNTDTGLGGYGAPVFRRDSHSSIIFAVTTSGDFDNGTGYWPDGAYINKPDEGNQLTTAAVPYFDSTEQEALSSVGFFSPNRMMPGPGMFGSLPTHTKRYDADATAPEKYAWKTLLFRKQPSHPNSVTVSAGGIPASAQDHLLMDFFWMPTVEPYAISEPFSTAGKVNMNYPLQPFTYIVRQTGLYAVLQKEKIAAADVSQAKTYKTSSVAGSPQSGTASLASVRLAIDPAETLKQFDTRFADSSGRIFLSPTELCDQWLVPQGQTVGSMAAFWAAKTLTGDNMRERPYTTIIPRLTTKSNTYTVHYRVQTLKAPKTITAGTWDESKGVITGEYRGSTTIQRFVDLSNTTLLTTDFATNTATVPTLDTFYRWRVINTKQFAP